MESFKKQIWREPDGLPPEGALALSHLPSMLGQVLWNRGVRSAEDAEAFFAPRYESLYDPFLFTNMRRAVDRVLRALEQGERVVIHGDYDADGMCGTALLWSAMEQVCDAAAWSAWRDGRISWYLPSREGDGYGMSMAAVERFAAEGAALIITVDCGIANVAEIARAYELGMEVMIVDHHQLPPECSTLPITIHPLAPGETYPFTKLAAVGVAFKVACALFAEARTRGIPLPVGQEKWLLDLVAIATVTDMVPLIGENRTLEYFGLQVLNKTRRVGLRALAAVSGIQLGALTETDVGFRIGPRLNAAGRIDKADVALQLLLSRTEEEAAAWADRLQALNVERRRLTDIAMKRSLANVDEAAPFVAVVDDDLHIGVAGLVAGRLCDRLGKPTVVMTRVGEHVVGSGRAPKGFNFPQAMEACREWMVQGGGHPEACGFKLTPEQVEPWCRAMQAFAEQTPLPPRSVQADVLLSFDDLSLDQVTLMERLAPFGMGHGVPLCLVRGVQAVTSEGVGASGAHWRLTVADGGRRMRSAIGFGLGEWAPRVHMGDILDLLCHLSVNEWNGQRQVQLELQDARFSV